MSQFFFCIIINKCCYSINLQKVLIIIFVCVIILNAINSLMCFVYVLGSWLYAFSLSLLYPFDSYSLPYTHIYVKRYFALFINQSQYPLITVKPYFFNTLSTISHLYRPQSSLLTTYTSEYFSTDEHQLNTS